MFGPTDGGKGMIRLRFSSTRAPGAPAIVAAANSHDRYFGARVGADSQQLTTSYTDPFLRRKTLSPRL